MNTAAKLSAYGAALALLVAALWRNDNHRGRRPAVWSPGEHLVQYRYARRL